VTIADALAALVAELRDNDIPDPLAQRLPLALIWSDLARLAGEPEPPEVARFLDAPAVATLRPAAIADAARWLPAD
jgi:hypothetical protein